MHTEHQTAPALPTTFHHALDAFQVEASRIAQALTVRPDDPSGPRRDLERAVGSFLAVASDLERALAHEPHLLRQAQAIFRERAAPLIARSWLVERSVRKPRGYAGDHAMLDAIYLGRRGGDGAGRLLDEMVLECAAGRAVVDRKRFAVEWLSERIAREPGAKIVDLACGPCRVERDLLEAGLGGQARFVGVDSDEEALLYAGRVLGAHAPRVELRRENAIHLARERRPSPLLAGASCIVSLGLFDYLPRAIAIRLLRALRTAARPGGELLVGNFAEENPSRRFMEWVGDWPLIHRTEEEFLGLFRAAGFGDADLQLEREADGGVVLLVTARMTWAPAASVTTDVGDAAAAA